MYENAIIKNIFCKPKNWLYDEDNNIQAYDLELRIDIHFDSFQNCLTEISGNLLTILKSIEKEHLYNMQQQIEEFQEQVINKLENQQNKSDKDPF